MKKALCGIYTLLSLILTGAMASEAVAQDMSGWSDKTVCRLLLNKPNEPAYTEELASRGFSCDSDQENDLLIDERFTSRYWSYIVPHKINSSRKAGEIDNGHLKVVVNPGTYGWSGDQSPGKERAEFAQQIIGNGSKLNRKQIFFMQFNSRVDKGFRASKRTMIAQVKVTDKSSSSPAAAFYLSDGGAAKCVDYRNSDNKSRHHQNHTSIRLKTGINVLDGEWHTFKIVLKIHDTEGYCKVSVDDKTIFEIKNYDSKDRSATGVLGRIGIYRDALPYQQVVYYDNWMIGYQPE